MEPQYIHTAHYGGEGHSLQPQYVVRGSEVFATRYNRMAPADKPLYTVQNGKWYATEFHPGGKNATAHVFEVRSHLF